jgi:hypothetical protein
MKAPELVIGNLLGEDADEFLEYLDGLHLRILELMERDGAQVADLITGVRKSRLARASRDGSYGLRRMERTEEFALQVPEGALWPLVTWRSGNPKSAMIQLREGMYLLPGSAHPPIPSPPPRDPSDGDVCGEVARNAPGRRSWVAWVRRIVFGES